VEETQKLDIKRYLHLVLKRRYLFAITAAFLITVVVIISQLIPPVYEAKTVVSIEKSFLNNILRNIGGMQASEDKATELSTIMKSRTLVFKVISELGLDINRMNDAEIEKLIKETQEKTHISIESRGAFYFTVSFQDRDPRRARDYVNTLVSKYIEESLSEKRGDSSGANRFLLDQIDQFKQKVAKLDVEIALLKKDPNVTLYNDYVDLQKRLSNLLVQYTENHPDVIKVQSELEALKSKYDVSQKKLAYAANISNQLTILERERQSNKVMYEELAGAFGKSELSAQAEMQDKAGTFKIVDPAVLPVKPISPNRIMIIFMGIVGGIAGAAGLIVLLDSFDDTIKNVDAIKSLGIPVLAIIPHIQDPGAQIKTRRKDIFLYTLSGLYIVLLGAFIVVERFGLSVNDLRAIFYPK
jgi:succinoglycan biosynthesis transport protein ExoP